MYTVTKVQVLNRGDCCSRRLAGAEVFVGETLCGKIDDAPAGAWISVNCIAQGQFLKIVGKKNTPLHFCGLKVWAVSGEETNLEE